MLTPGQVVQAGRSLGAENVSCASQPNSRPCDLSGERCEFVDLIEYHPRPTIVDGGLTCRRRQLAAELENVIHEKIRMLLEERGGDVPAIHGADTLNGALGLSSLDLAIVVAELESALGVDPFSKIVSITSVRSVDDLVEAYLKAYLPQTKPEEQDEDLLEAARRARGRRARRGA